MNYWNKRFARALFKADPPSIQDNIVKRTKGLTFVQRTVNGNRETDTKVIDSSDDILCWISGESIDDFINALDKKTLGDTIDKYRI